MNANKYARRVHARLNPARRGRGIATVYENRRDGSTTHYGAPIETAARVIRIVIMSPVERGQ